MPFNLKLITLPQKFAICQLLPQAQIQQLNDFFAIVKTDEEISLVCTEEHIPINAKCNKFWICLKVLGALDFSLTGILNSLTKPLAEAKISIFAISSFNTDYLLVKEKDLNQAMQALKEAGFEIEVDKMFESLI